MNVMQFISKITATNQLEWDWLHEMLVGQFCRSVDHSVVVVLSVDVCDAWNGRVPVLFVSSGDLNTDC